MKRRKLSKKRDESGGKFEINTFRLEIFSLIRKKRPEIYKANEWDNLSDKEKIIKILSDSKAKNWEVKNSLHNLLDRVLKTVLEDVYDKYYKRKKMSKKARIYELIAGFLEEESPLNKREKEEKNIQSIGDVDDELKFFEFCGIAVPGEIVSLIFNFFERNYGILTTIGSTCKHFYIKLLSSWNHISVDQHNLHSISLLALQSTKSLKIEFINQSEQKYVWKHVIKNPRLQKLHIAGINKYIRSSLSLLHKLRKKKKTPFPLERVDELELKSSSSKCQDLNVTFSEIFPNLKKLGCGFGSESLFKLFKGCPRIDDILINLSFSVKEALENFKRHVDPTPIRKLRFGFHPYHSVESEEISKFISLFPNIESISVNREIRRMFHKRQHQQFDIGDLLQHSKTNKKLSIIELFFASHKMTEERIKEFQQSFEDSSIQIIYPSSNDTSNTMKIEHLEIISVSSGYNFLNVLDFNLEEILQSNFLVNRLNHLKTFKGDVPLGKRSRSLSSIFSKNDEELMENELESLVVAIEQFVTFFSDSIMRNDEFEKFEIKIRSRDLWFGENETLFLKYDHGGMTGMIRRLRIGYDGKNLVEDYADGRRSRECLCRLLFEEKRPCLLLFQEILEELDVSCFDVIVLDPVDRNCEGGVWRRKMIEKVRGNEDVFVFEESDLMICKRSLL